MAANPWIPGSRSSSPSTEGKNWDEQSPAGTADTDNMSDAGTSYADKFLAARKANAQAADGDSDAPAPKKQMPADAATPTPPSDTGNKAQTDPTEFRPAQAALQHDPDVGESEASPGSKRQPENNPPTPEPADANRELLRALTGKRDKSPNAKLGKFPRKRERQAVTNLRELSLVEGNLMGLGPTIRTLYFTSCFAGEGKTTALLETAYGLAIHDSHTTLLIDGNSDNPCLHGEFGLSNRNGFRDVLRGAASLSEAILPTVHENLYVLPCGNGKSTPDTSALASVLHTLADNFDFVLIDGKPLLSSSEVSTMAPKVNGVLLVVECEKTKWEVVQLAQDKLKAVDVKNTGLVLNRRRFYIPKPIYRLMSR